MEIQERRIHTLGNLTLLTPAQNSQLADHGWSTKRAAFATSGYALTRELADAVAEDAPWTLEEIDTRADRIAGLVVAIWPRPRVAPHDVEGEAEPGMELDDDGDEEPVGDEVDDSELLLIQELESGHE